MREFNVFKQRGAVLAFSLVMLLLLTLVGVSMIQQNKQQFGMANNTLQQTQALATVEAELLRAETIIDGMRYDLTGGKTKANHQCKALPQLDEETVITPAATVKEVYCLVWTGGAEQRCLYNNGVRDLDNPQPPNNACIRLNQAGSGNGDINDRCPIEIYTLHTTFSDGNTGAQRTIESKYAVDCTSTPP